MGKSQRICALLLSLFTSTVAAHSQQMEAAKLSANKAQTAIESLPISHEAQCRMGHALAAFESMVQAGRYISSISELIKDKEMPMPVGLKSSTYTICIEELYEDSVWTYDMDTPLESRKHYRVHAKMTFERLDGDKWVAVVGDDDKPYSEEKTIEFTSGERPKYIMPEHVAYAYPADRQYNLLTREHGEAYIIWTLSCEAPLHTPWQGYCHK